MDTNPLPMTNSASSSSYFGGNGSHFNSSSVNPDNAGPNYKSRSRSRSRSPVRDREYRDYDDSRSSRHGSNNRLANTAPPGRVLGVFGLSPQTGQDEIEREFKKYGAIEKVDLIMDRKTQRSKCFAFVYFYEKDHAINAKNRCQNLELDGKIIRTDYSASERAHEPTPGKYHGEPRYSPYGGRDRGDRDRDRGRDRGYRDYDRGGDRDRNRDRERDRGYGGRSSRDDRDRDRDRNRDRGYSSGYSGNDDRYSGGSRRYDDDKYSSSSSYRDSKYSSSSSSYDSGRRDYDELRGGSSYR